MSWRTRKKGSRKQRGLRFKASRNPNGNLVGIIRAKTVTLPSGVVVYQSQLRQIRFLLDRLNSARLQQDDLRKRLKTAKTAYSEAAKEFERAEKQRQIVTETSTVAQASIKRAKEEFMSVKDRATEIQRGIDSIGEQLRKYGFGSARDAEEWLKQR